MMQEITLRKDTAAVLKKLHTQYKKRIRSGMSKANAADFGSSKTIHEAFFPKSSFEDIDSVCEELLNANMLDGFRADGYVYRAVLSDAGIAFSENYISKSASTIFGLASELVQAIRSLLPW